MAARRKKVPSATYDAETERQPAEGREKTYKACLVNDALRKYMVQNPHAAMSLVEELFNIAINEKDPHAKIKAIQYLWDRDSGKPKEQIEVTGDTQIVMPTIQFYKEPKLKVEKTDESNPKTD
jgi:hypothetical protein